MSRYHDMLHQLEAQFLLAELTARRWNITRFAREMGIDKCTVYRRLDVCGVKIPERIRATKPSMSSIAAPERIEAT